MKRALIPLMALTLLFSACSGSSDSSSTSDGEEPYFFEYITADFAIEVPEDWETITAFTSEYPDEVRVAFRNNVKDSDFIANIVILREDNTDFLSNADFAQEKLQDHSETLVNYKLLSQEELTLTVSGANSSTLLNTFEGKNETNSSTLEFKQVYLVKGDEAWTATASYRSNEDSFVVEDMEHMLTSFNLK